MQSYRETSSVSQLDPLPGTSRSHRTGKSRAGDGGAEDEVELGKWRQRYEETMNPFEAFRGRVRGFHVQVYTRLTCLTGSDTSIYVAATPGASSRHAHTSGSRTSSCETCICELCERVTSLGLLGRLERVGMLGGWWNRGDG